MHYSDSNIKGDQYASAYKWQGPQNNHFDDTVSLMNGYKSNSTCRVMTIRDNCFSHNPDRARNLLNRYWKLNSKPKWFVDIADSDELPRLLVEFQNKSIAFFGDSTVLSVFTSFVCYLGQGTDTEYKMVWLDDEDHILLDVNGQTKCPYHPSCYILAGVVFLPEYQITLIYDQINTYNNRHTKQVLHTIVDGPNPRPDVVIINLGVHYNDLNSFVHEVWSLKGDLKNILHRQKEFNSKYISWHWLESFPQHFPNGYFSEGDGRGIAHTLESVLPSNATNASINPAILNCKPYLNATDFYQKDWRNRLPEQIMHEFYTHHRVIKIAEPLYEQWDAHVDYGDSRRILSTSSDCTHYCTASGIFRFVLNEVVSSVKKCLHNCTRDLFS